MQAHAKGVDAAAGADPIGLAFQIGYIHAIVELARQEGAQQVEGIAIRKRNDLDKRAMELA
jgi:hypothetical protein